MREGRLLQRVARGALGGILVLLTAASNDPARRETTRWGGMILASVLLPRYAREPVTPLVVLVIGVALIAVGVGVELLWGDF